MIGEAPARLIEEIVKWARAFSRPANQRSQEGNVWLHGSVYADRRIKVDYLEATLL
jgi:hypothetical protein